MTKSVFVLALTLGLVAISSSAPLAAQSSLAALAAAEAKRRAAFAETAEGKRQAAAAAAAADEHAASDKAAANAAAERMAVLDKVEAKEVAKDKVAAQKVAAADAIARNTLAQNQAAKAAAIAARRKRGDEKRLFNPWDRSHRASTNRIKQSMNDPESYEHVKTTFIDMGDHLIVTTMYRGKNAFGGVVSGSMTAEVDLDGNVVRVISNGR